MRRPGTLQTNISGRCGNATIRSSYKIFCSFIGKSAAGPEWLQRQAVWFIMPVLFSQSLVDKQRMVIVAYDRPNECEGYYSDSLKPLALRYRNQGMSWQDADKKAYDELYARLESEGY